MGQKNGWLLGWLLGDGASKGEPSPDIRLDNRFVSPAEREFYLVLRRVVEDRAILLVQVSLNQLLHVPRGEKGTPQAGWRNRIAQKSIDFLLVHPQSFQPLVAIELDEPSHARPSRQSRDEVVETALEAAGLPLVRVLTSKSYDTREIEAALLDYLVGKTS